MSKTFKDNTSYMENDFTSSKKKKKQFKKKRDNQKDDARYVTLVEEYQSEFDNDTTLLEYETRREISN